MTLTSVISMLTAPLDPQRFRARPHAPRYCPRVSVRPTRARKPSATSAARARLRRTRVLEQPEVARAAPGEGGETRALPQEDGPNASRLLAQRGGLLERRLLEVVLQEPVGTGSLQLPRYKVEDAITLLPGCQSCIQTSEYPGGRDGDPRIHHDHVGPELATEWVHLVPPREPQGGPPQQEIGHVGPEAAGQPVQPVGAQAEPPHPVQAQQDGRRIARPASESPAHRDPLRGSRSRPLA